MWSIILRLASVIGGLMAISEAPGVIHDVTAADNATKEAEALANEREMIQARTERTKAVTRLVIIATAILGGFATIITIIFTKKHKRK